MSYGNSFRTKTKKLNEVKAKEAEARIKKLKQELEDNPRTYLQCAARGCEGCIVCERDKY